MIDTAGTRTPLELRVDPADVFRLCDDIDARLDCSDFWVASLMKVLFAAPDKLGQVEYLRVRSSLLDFPYWLDEPGTDLMCHWSENHQVMFAVVEMLAGQLFPTELFRNAGIDGSARYARGKERLLTWLGDRFRFGFSEWNSTTYYEVNVAALSLCVDYCDDADVRTRAAMVLDILMLDMALHHFQGNLVGTAGRSYEEAKKFPHHGAMRQIMAHAFAEPVFDADWTRMSMLFTSSTYRTPPAIRAVAQARGTHAVRCSTGLDVREVARELTGASPERLGLFYWLMEAFSTVPAVHLTSVLLRKFGMTRNKFLSSMRPFAELTRLPGAKSVGLLPWLVRTLNPVAQGIALQRANIVTMRSETAHVSSVQNYHPGEFGDQQHLWQATLPGNVTVFSTHPGGPMMPEEHRNATPSEWVGNGVNPMIGQRGNVVLAMYDLSVRRGFREHPRQQLTHLYFPFLAFDATRLGKHWVAGRARNAYIGIRSLAPLEMVGRDELRQRGERTGYAVVVMSATEVANLDAFVELLKDSDLQWRGSSLHFRSRLGHHRLKWRRGLWHDGRREYHEFARYESPWVNVGRKPQAMTVECGGSRLDLEWDAGLRTLT